MGTVPTLSFFTYLEAVLVVTLLYAQFSSQYFKLNSNWFPNYPDPSTISTRYLVNVQIHPDFSIKGVHLRNQLQLKFGLSKFHALFPKMMFSTVP